MEDHLHQWTAHYHLPDAFRKALGCCFHRNNATSNYRGLFALAIEAFPVRAEYMWRQLKKNQVHEQSFKEAFPGAVPPQHP